MDYWLIELVTVLVVVGLRRYRMPSFARSSPSFLPTERDITPLLRPSRSHELLGTMVHLVH